MLKKIWCVPVATWFIPIATLAYRCSKVSSFSFVICFVSKVMPYFTSTVLCLLISGALVVSSVWSIGCSVVTFYRLRSNLGSTATYRCILQLQHIQNCAKLWYRTVWNIINTGTFPVPVYRAFLLKTTVMMLKIQLWSQLLHLTIISHTKQLFKIVIIFHNITVFVFFTVQINAVLLSRRDFF